MTTQGSRRAFSRWAALLLAAIPAAGCDGASPSAPSSIFTITGRVSDGTQGLPSIVVEILSGPNAGRRVTTNPDGDYALPALVAGELSLRASAPGYQPQTVLVRLERNTTVDFRLLRRAEPGSDDLVAIAGVVQDREGAVPIPGAEVRIITGSDSGRQTTTDVDGRFLLDRLRPGALTLEISALGYRSAVRSLRAGAVETLRVGLEREPGAGSGGISLSGLVGGILTPRTAPVPVEGALVALVDGPNTGRTARTNPDGRYRLDEITPGVAGIEVTAPGFQRFTARVTLDASTTVDVVLTPVEPTVFTRGRAVDVLTGAALAEVTITGPGITAAPSDARGAFAIGAVSGSREPRLIELASPASVRRQTHIQVPDDDIELSLIPVTFNLTAFDEMLRDPRLRRWRTAPPLVIERQTLRLASVDAAQGTALDDAMSDEELQSLLTDLRWALPRLTGSAFQAFDGVTERETIPGQTSTLLTAGAITVVRVDGLEVATGTWGWARWLFAADGTITGGAIMLDLDFDRSNSPYRRSLRAHELGHALGYAHVFSAPSVMHPDARREPTAFDRDATRIAFAREPGNLAPDVGPEPATTASRSGTGEWSRPVR